MFDLISILTQLVSSVCPIKGLSEEADSYVIQFAAEATPEQKASANAIIANKDAITEKYQKLDKLDADFATSIDAGFTTSYGWKLGLKNDDLTLLSSLYLMARTCVEMSLPLPEIIDTDGVAHNLSFEMLTTVMLQYGAYRADLSKNYAEQKKIIEG
tara:strand:- start:107 stop:577 length:471 start_codon:yes stop_codon:yes gene_type:complete